MGYNSDIRPEQIAITAPTADIIVIIQFIFLVDMFGVWSNMIPTDIPSPTPTRTNPKYNIQCNSIRLLPLCFYFSDIASPTGVIFYKFSYLGIDCNCSDSDNYNIRLHPTSAKWEQTVLVFYVYFSLFLCSLIHCCAAMFAQIAFLSTIRT